MIDILVFGHWDNATRIAGALSSRAADMRAVFVPQRDYLRVLARPPRSERVLLVRAGYRVGASTWRGRLFDAYWDLLRRSIPRSVGCHYWLGTDVLDTLAEARAGTLRTGALAASRSDFHLAVAPWLVSELKGVGVAASYALLPPPVPAPAAVPPLPDRFTVLTYAPSMRFEFYGGETILEVARRMPHVQFDIVGAPGEPSAAVDCNVTRLGWVDDMADRYARTTVVVRIPGHDGYGNTVIEGLLYGRHVIYTQEVPFVRRVWPATPDAVAVVIGDLHDAHVAGRLELNLPGRAYGLRAYDPATLEDHLAALVRSAA
jgi:hypothetical protein